MYQQKVFIWSALKSFKTNNLTFKSTMALIKDNWIHVLLIKNATLKTFDLIFLTCWSGKIFP